MSAAREIRFESPKEESRYFRDLKIGLFSGEIKLADHPVSKSSDLLLKFLKSSDVMNEHPEIAERPLFGALLSRKYDVFLDLVTTSRRILDEQQQRYVVYDVITIAISYSLEEFAALYRKLDSRPHDAVIAWQRSLLPWYLQDTATYESSLQNNKR